MMTGIGWSSSRVPSSARAVSAGSSERTRAGAATIASACARRACTSRRASGPVIHWLVPSSAAARPSRLCAHFTVTCGRPLRCRCVQSATSASAASASGPARRRPGCAQAVGSAGRGVGGVVERVDHAGDARLDERDSARAGATGVIARLQGHHGSGALCGTGGELRQRVDLGVAVPAPRWILGDNLTAGDRITAPTWGLSPRGRAGRAAELAAWRRSRRRMPFPCPSAESGQGQREGASRRPCCLLSGLARAHPRITVGPEFHRIGPTA